MNNCVEQFGNLKKLFTPNLRQYNPQLYDALFNTDSYYDMLRKDMDECCELALRYNLIVNEKRGLLKGGRNIYEYSFLNEFRVARLFERYFGKGCLAWDPPGQGDSTGEFLLNINNTNNIKYCFFVEVKTRTEQRITKYGTLCSNEDSIENLLQKAYRKAPKDRPMPFLVVLCHDHFKINIDEYQVIKSCFGTIVFQKGSPEVVSPGFCSPTKHQRLSAIGVYYYNFSKNLPEKFEIYHNPNAHLPIDNHIFENKADKQWNLSNWNGSFN
jgi:hypothetical protein